MHSESQISYREFNEQKRRMEEEFGAEAKTLNRQQS